MLPAEPGHVVNLGKCGLVARDAVTAYAHAVLGLARGRSTVGGMDVQGHGNSAGQEHGNDGINWIHINFYSPENRGDYTGN